MVLHGSSASHVSERILQIRSSSCTSHRDSPDLVLATDLEIRERLACPVGGPEQRGDARRAGLDHVQADDVADCGHSRFFRL